MSRRFGSWLAIALAALAVVTVLTAFSSTDRGARLPNSPFAVLGSCSSGGLELSDLECAPSGHCRTKTMRLSWTREGGALFEGDGQNERELARLSSSRAGALVTELAAALSFRDTDAAGPVCAKDGFDVRGCLAEGRKLGINADCSNVRSGIVVMRSSFRTRWEDAKRSCLLVGDAFDETVCKGKTLMKGAGGTHLSDRVIRMMERMRAVASGSDE